MKTSRTWHFASDPSSKPGINMRIVFAIVLLAFTTQARRLERRGSCGSHGKCKNTITGHCPLGWRTTASSICGFLEACCYQDSTEEYKGNLTTPSGKPCGTPTYSDEDRIVSGSKTTIDEYPWTVSLRKGYIWTSFCGGSIIDKYWILTAAHCVQDSDDLTILAGTEEANNVLPTLYHDVKKIIAHPDYNDITFVNDIALLKLKKGLDLSQAATRAICLPQPGQTFDNDVCAVAGWGDKEEGDGDGSGMLRELDVPIADKETCQSYMHSTTKPFICAGTFEEGGDGVCQGDSGSAVACLQTDGAWVQAGIVSHGRGCARDNTYDMHTEVSAYVDWIKQTIEENS